MKLKASIDYGVRAIVYLAIKGGTCSSREISDEMCVPRDYLIQLALRMRNAGLIKARPGKNGGYVLAKDPDDITIGMVLNAFDSDLKHVRQPMKKDSKASESAQIVKKAHGIVTKSFNSYLDSITVKDIIDATGDGADPNEILAAAFDAEAERLRSE